MTSFLSDKNQTDRPLISASGSDIIRMKNPKPGRSAASPVARLSLGIAVFAMALWGVTLGQAFGQVSVVIRSPTVSKAPPFTGERSAVDVALLLDTSNSMDGLIDQAKSQLWSVVREFARAKRDGQTPTLRVALFEYGNTRLPASEGYLRQVLPLSDDLDALSEALFSLTTSGGDEFCGQVVDEALKRLDWASDANNFQAIFIAGNEPFTQGTVDYKKSCRHATDRGVVLNTIYCGDHDSGVTGFWKDAADRAEGKYFNIDHNEVVIQIDCPQDAKILELNQQLNATYLWYGSESARRSSRGRQESNDGRAMSQGAHVQVERAAAKATGLYQNRKRDLVDGVASDHGLWSRLGDDDLPAELRNVPRESRPAFVAKMAKERTAIQKQITVLSAQRDQYIAEHRAVDKSTAPSATLGEVMGKAVRAQLQDAGFTRESADGE